MPMRIDTFAMERMQSTYENQVEFNLSESGVHPLRLDELVDEEAERAALMAQPLAYTQSNGTPELRALVAAMYPGATIDHVEVTNGGSEANFITTWQLVEPGDEVVMMVPNYMQTWGLARAFGGNVRTWPLRETDLHGSLEPARGAGGKRGEAAPPSGGNARWRPDFDELKRLVSDRTKLIILCNPNNPTGARLDAADLDLVCAIAGRHGSWILSDEIYRGAELDGRETPSVWGRYDRAIVTSGLSKAYGLPGLRIGWIVGPREIVATSWSYHDYTTIAPPALSDRLARVALEPARRQRLLERTRRILRANYPIVRDWLAGHGDAFAHIPPEAGAILYVRYRYDINSTELVVRLRETKSVLIVPGDHFHMDGYLRIGYGDRVESLKQGLSRLHDMLIHVGIRGQGAGVRAVSG